MRQTFILFLLIFSTTMAFSQEKPRDFLTTGQLQFNNETFGLAWSSHPSTGYYKQEYLKKGETVQQYKTMLILEVLAGSTKPLDAMNAKVAELKQMQASNPFIKYQVLTNAPAGEYLLDFVITANSPDNKSVKIAERNLYRYCSLAKTPGILLFAVSQRSYGADTKPFLASFESSRAALVDKVKKVAIPEVRL